jgi:hypothetical protein
MDGLRKSGGKEAVLSTGPNESQRLRGANAAFQRLVLCFSKLPTGVRSAIMTLALAGEQQPDFITMRMIRAIRKDLEAILPADCRPANPSIIAELDDTQTELEVAFAIDSITRGLLTSDRVDVADTGSTEGRTR